MGSSLFSETKHFVHSLTYLLQSKGTKHSWLQVYKVYSTQELKQREPMKWEIKKNGMECIVTPAAWQTSSHFDIVDHNSSAPFDFHF